MYYMIQRQPRPHTSVGMKSIWGINAPSGIVASVSVGIYCPLGTTLGPYHALNGIQCPHPTSPRCPTNEEGSAYIPRPSISLGSRSGAVTDPSDEEGRVQLCSFEGRLSRALSIQCPRTYGTQTLKLGYKHPCLPTQV